ncbi:MAG TPA: PLP-dependent aminotransferase family protein [Pseudohaliea sp.]|nr:PLP-dependent aminotransferase family protein [Pseudohaliea sp.]HKL61781.1 PLP-dependent aminotransferase family protein [Woeseiaceae bacterium]
MGFDYSAHFRKDLPAPAPAPFKGFPPYYFVGGNNAPEALPVPALIEAATAALEKEGPHLAIYNLKTGPQGYGPLRDWLVGRLKSWCQMDVAADNIIVTSGSLQALDLVHEALLEPGDVVAIEGGTYGGTMTRLADQKAEYVGVEMDGDGIIPDALERVLADVKAAGKRCKYVYTIPTVQNPTGTIMSLARRHALLEIARKHDIMIFEDDCYADLVWSGERPPAIYSLDTEGRVVYCGSFSKTIAPALRVGYLVAEWPFIAQCLPLKKDAGTGALEQITLAEFCPKHFDDHVAKLTGLFQQKCDAIQEALAENFGAAAEFRPPEGGIFIWVTLPEQVDTSKLFAAAAAEGVMINPGREWVADPETGKHSLRLCFGQPSLEEIKGGVAKLAEICHREFGVPVRIGNVERG